MHAPLLYALHAVNRLTFFNCLTKHLASTRERPMDPGNSGKGPALVHGLCPSPRRGSLVYKPNNPSTWGAPRIHGELVMLGFELSERTISRGMHRSSRNPEPAQRWLSFLRNHRKAIAAMDFFSVPTVTLNLFHCFFIIGHDRRRILHFKTSHSIRQALGSSSSYAKPAPISPRLRSRR